MHGYLSVLAKSKSDTFGSLVFIQLEKYGKYSAVVLKQYRKATSLVKASILEGPWGVTEVTAPLLLGKPCLKSCKAVSWTLQAFSLIMCFESLCQLLSVLLQAPVIPHV